MTRQKGSNRNIEPIREYDPYQPRAFSAPQNPAPKRAPKDKGGVTDAAADIGAKTVQTPLGYKRVGLFYVPVK